jgi:tetratricopeptide (TPR) repeat protein
VTVSVSQAAKKVQVLVSCINLSNDTTFWSLPFDFNNSADVLGMESNVLRQTQSALKVQVLDSRRAELERPPTRNDEAYLLYAQGLYEFGQQTPNNNARAIELFKKALDLDPTFARASCGLARAYLYKEKMEEPGRWADLVQSTIQDALRQQLPEAYAVQGELYFTSGRQWDERRAVKALQKAIALKPNLMDAHEMLGFIFFHCGFFLQSETNLEQTLETRPANVGYLCQPYMYDCNSSESWKFQKQYTNDVSLWDSVWNPALCLDYLDRRKEAWNLLNASLAYTNNADHPALLSVKAIFLAKEGRPEEALKCIEVAKHGERRMVHFHHTRYQIASAYALMNDKTNALQWLKEAADDGFPCYPYFAKDPNLTSLHGYAPFESFIADQKRDWLQRKQDFFGTQQSN